MREPQRIQLSRAKGWRMPFLTVNVARPTIWGNPFYVSKWRDAATCVALYRDSVQGIWNPATSEHLPQAWQGYAEHTEWHQRWRKRMNCSPIEWVPHLRGMHLACWCKLGEPCHAQVLLELANADGVTGGSDADQA